MISRRFHVLSLFLLFLTASCCVWTQNPIICDRYTPDPAPYVHGDTLYLFVDHDENETINGYFTMKDWLLYSTVDMVNWTYRGTPLTSATFSAWAKQDNDCWASQCIERDGKWYWYVTATIKGEAYPGIGVAVADNPAGPYKDPIKKPLVKGWFKIDPSVFIDDDGQAYLFYGNNMLWYTKLTKKMTAITGGEKEVKTKDENAFGPYKGYDDKGNPKTNFEEASWIYKRGGKYYLEYAAGGVPEHWAYSTADAVTGPWTYQGKILKEAEGSFTIHGGSVEFRGHHYMFYHNGKLPGGGGYKRATCVEEFTPNEDGTIPAIAFSTKGVEPLQTVNPFVRQEAETINQSSGILCEGDYNGCYVTNISNGDYIKVRGVDFGSAGAKSFHAWVRGLRKGTLNIRTGSKTGAVKGKVVVEPTDGEWTEVLCDLTTAIKGTVDLFFTFSGTGQSLFDFDGWQFGQETIAADKSVDITVDGKTRSYWLHVPSTVKGNCPLVVSLHGASGHSTDRSPFRADIADKEGCIVVYPQGEPIYFPVFGGTVNGWDASGEVNKDVEFLKAVIEDVASKYSINRKRIYCCGFSNGGMMTYALTNTCSDLFAAFASISGFPLNEFHFRHTGARPVPFLHIHGKKDDFVRYALMPVIVDEMVARIGANPVPKKTTVSGKYDKSIYEAAEGSFPYIYYEINNMGHNDFTSDIESNNSAQVMWDFFKQYTLDSPCDTTLKWMPRLETEGYTPKNHGWTLNSGTTIMRFGGEQNTDGKQNVYRSLQLTTGTYKLRFHSEGDADKTVGVKIQKLTGKKTVVLNATSPVGTDACFVFSVEDGWGEYRLTISRPAAADQITVTNLGLYSLTEEELTGVRDIEHSSFRMDHSPLMRYDLVGRMTNSKSSHGLCLVPNGNGMVRKILIK
ncbi:MAG: family 43 glycosylhydrolase [Bacteroidaceae bacterium]|nr:family 43 glycosylhydrolase [Bacteroidaceae bacterium]